jgi:predicted ribosome quality control (RQC) complex YloA/Tae2 family protein
MQLHYFTLKRQANYLNRLLKGFLVRECFSQVKNELVFSLESENQETGYLLFSSHPQFPFFLFSEKIGRLKNSTDLFEEIIGRVIKDVQILHNERIFLINLNDVQLNLYIQLFTNRSNILLLDADHKIMNAFKKRKQLEETTYTIPSAEIIDIFTEHAYEKLWGELKQAGKIKISKFLKLNLPFVNQTIADEILFLANLPGEANSKEISQQGFFNFLKIGKSLFEKFEHEAPRIHYQNGLPHKFTLGQFQHLEKLDSEIFENINSALRAFNFQSQKNQRLTAKKKHYLLALEEKISHLKNTQEKLKATSEDPSKKDYYKKIGELILAQPESITPGEKTATLLDYFSPSMEKIVISINPTLNANENANLYFEKAKGFEKKTLHRKRRRNEINGLIKRLENLSEELKSANSIKQIEKYEPTLKSEHILQKSDREASQTRLPYKQYFFKNYELWVGRNARDNDKMTFEFAHKEDWWLHVQGYSGSHIIIRNPLKKEQLDNQALNYAASLAITYSAAKHASYVPVIYTRVKYLRKPRKSPPGTVIPNNTKLIFADPLSKTSR